MAEAKFTDHATVVRKDGGLKMRKRVVRAYVPGTSVLLLSDASKMPSLSWSLPAGESCPWALYGEGSICGGCYAQQGRYVMPNVVAAQRARFDWTRESLKTAAGRERWVATMASAIAAAGNRYFRVHDAGDLFSPEYVDLWTAVVRVLPEVRFWFPTRAWRVLGMQRLSPATRERWALALMSLAAEPNVALRPSALYFGAPAPVVPGMAAGTTAAESGFTCPAASQGNVCGSCRVCYDAPQVAVSYHKHGRKMGVAR